MNRSRYRNAAEYQRHLERRFGKVSNGFARRRGLSLPRVMFLIVVASCGAILLLPKDKPIPRQAAAAAHPVIRNCDEARALGLSNARRGEPGYWPWLDRDQDGIACEPYLGR